MAKPNDTAPAAEKLVEVRLLRNYVPREGEFHISADDLYAGTPRESKLYIKRLAGEILTLPRDEAKAVIAAKIAEITADLI